MSKFDELQQQQTEDFRLTMTALGVMRDSLQQVTGSVQHLNDSVQQVKDSVEQVKHSVEQVTDTVEQVKDSVEQVKDSVEQVKHSVEQVEQGLERQHHTAMQQIELLAQGQRSIESRFEEVDRRLARLENPAA